VGATGMVGNEMLRVLSQREFPSERVIALASERSKGLTVAYNGGSITVDELKESAFKGIDIALFAASGDIALMYGPVAAEAGALVIDNSSAWRMKQNVPLVVPEVNSEDIRDNEGIIANPNCCAIPLTVILHPLQKKAGLERGPACACLCRSGTVSPYSSRRPRRSARMRFASCSRHRPASWSRMTRTPSSIRHRMVSPARTRFSSAGFGTTLRRGTASYCGSC